MPDHVHMLISDNSQIFGGEDPRIHERDEFDMNRAECERAGCGIFWATNSGRYFVTTVGRDDEVTRAYIRNQELADRQLERRLN